MRSHFSRERLLLLVRGLLLASVLFFGLAPTGASAAHQPAPDDHPGKVTVHLGLSGPDHRDGRLSSTAKRVFAANGVGGQPHSWDSPPGLLVSGERQPAPVAGTVVLDLGVRPLASPVQDTAPSRAPPATPDR